MVSAIGNLFGNTFPQTTIKKQQETAGSLAFTGTETAGSLANNVGGSFCAMA